MCAKINAEESGTHSTILRSEWLVFQLNFSLSLWAYKTCVDVQPFDGFIDQGIYNGHKFLCADEISELAHDRVWLDKATNTLSKHWYLKNQHGSVDKDAN
jgi:hypothetical protein